MFTKCIIINLIGVGLITNDENEIDVEFNELKYQSI